MGNQEIDQHSYAELRVEMSVNSDYVKLGLAGKADDLITMLHSAMNSDKDFLHIIATAYLTFAAANNIDVPKMFQTAKEILNT